MLTNFDKSLLNIIQRNLPISERPFLELAKILETTEDHVIERLRYLKEHGYIRRIGPFFDSGKLEYKGTLVALYSNFPYNALYSSPYLPVLSCPPLRDKDYTSPYGD